MGEHDFGRLLLQFETRIYSYIRSFAVHATDAEDLLQETASVLWRKFDQFQPDTSFLAWALQVARYKVLEFRRRQKRDALQFSETFIDVVAADTMAESEQLGELQQWLSECMDKLAPADRELIEMRYWSDLPVTTLAARLGRPASTIYDAINRVRRLLVECVERALNRSEWEGNAMGGRPDQPPPPQDEEYRT
jgi:RNA polymerase sigma-70 factor (ECF subfamily)